MSGARVDIDFSPAHRFKMAAAEYLLGREINGIHQSSRVSFQKYDIYSIDFSMLFTVVCGSTEALKELPRRCLLFTACFLFGEKMLPLFKSSGKKLDCELTFDFMFQLTKKATPEKEDSGVAWIKVDTETLLSYHTHVIPRDNRLKVTNSNSDRQWFLHIKNLDVSDRGFYMCQINTEPMISEKGYLDVTGGYPIRWLNDMSVPPSIVEENTSTDITVDERSRVSLRCKAAGYPSPRVVWRREDGKEINLGPMGAQKSSVLRLEGEFLNMTQVTREDMGAYLCIASNGIPPSVSKRILLQVNFQRSTGTRLVDNNFQYILWTSTALPTKHMYFMSPVLYFAFQNNDYYNKLLVFLSFWKQDHHLC
ncbi:lachesin [Caerostris extrusa]|uniref:Lachesin n=1 Tax=Caerostris extrusa TaxID=172846 RepID=A0AAV4PRB8_CAEEX|nr:lachesin [Caerostris extrusa]